MGFREYYIKRPIIVYNGHHWGKFLTDHVDPKDTEKTWGSGSPGKSPTYGYKALALVVYDRLLWQATQQTSG